ncbi:Uncharacterised protein [Serratia liquefaciens]|nr:Uncharacterised protein [Serratia liquefaciens]
MILCACSVPYCLADHGASVYKDVIVNVTNEGTCKVTASGGGFTISAPFPAQAGGPNEIGVIHVDCTIPGETYAAISNSSTGPWDTTATLKGNNANILQAAIGRRLGGDQKNNPSVMLSAGTVNAMIGSKTGDFDLQLTYTGTNPDSWNLHVLVGRWSD